MNNTNNLEYKIALERVKKIKGFYNHLIIYIIVNIFIVFININDLDPGESYFKYENFITLTFWGIGVFAHAASVFIPNWIFGENWEKRKIKELMNKYNKTNNIQQN